MSIYKDCPQLSVDFPILPFHLAFSQAVEQAKKEMSFFNDSDLPARSIDTSAFSIHPDIKHKILFTSQKTGKLLVSIS